MTRRTKSPKDQRKQPKSKAAARTPEEVFAYWDKQAMREARPVPLEIEGPIKDHDSKEK